MVVIWRQKRPYLLVGWFWYGIMMVPVIGLVQVGAQAHADRYTYLSEIGLCVMLTWLAADLFARMRQGRAIQGGAAVVILAALIYSGQMQVSSWKNSETLWRHALACDQDDIQAYNSLGNYFYKGKRFDDAIAQFKEAVKINPKMAAGYNNLGMAYFAKREFPMMRLRNTRRP